MNYVIVATMYYGLHEMSRMITAGEYMFQHGQKSKVDYFCVVKLRSNGYPFEESTINKFIVFLPDKLQDITASFHIFN